MPMPRSPYWVSRYNQNAEDETSSAFFAFLNIQNVYSIIRYLDGRKVLEYGKNTIFNKL